MWLNVSCQSSSGVFFLWRILGLKHSHCLFVLQFVSLCDFRPTKSLCNTPHLLCPPKCWRQRSKQCSNTHCREYWGCTRNLSITSGSFQGKVTVMSFFFRLGVKQSPTSVSIRGVFTAVPVCRSSPLIWLILSPLHDSTCSSDKPALCLQTVFSSIHSINSKTHTVSRKKCLFVLWSVVRNNYPSWTQVLLKSDSTAGSG